MKIINVRQIIEMIHDVVAATKALAA